MSLYPGEPPEFIQGPDGRYRIKNQRTGKLDPPWKHVTHTKCCDDFEHYVRTCDDCDEFPYHPTENRELVHKNLWPGRKLRICFVSDKEKGVPFWSKAQVVSFREASTVAPSIVAPPGNPSCWEKIWYMKVEFKGPIGPGIPVLLHGLQAKKEHNGRIGVVTDKLTAKGRFPVTLVLKGETEEPGRLLAVLPGNLNQVITMEFFLCRINVQGGGTMLEISQSREGPRLSFEWMERISEEKPWYFVVDPPEAPWRQPFTVHEKIEDLRTYRAEQMEDCLQHENEELVSEKLTEHRDHTVKSLRLLTRHGGTDAMREARRILLTHPLPMVVLVLKELASGGYDEEFHLLHAGMVSFFEIWKQTNGFLVDEFGPTERTVYAHAGIEDAGLGDALNLRLWAVFWWSFVVRRFWALKEFRAILRMHDECVSSIGADVLKPQIEEDFAAACKNLCDFESLLAVVDNGPRIVKMKEDWTGSSGTLTPLVTPFEAIYSPRQISGTFEDCIVCGRQTGDPYWCKKCGEVPYCSKQCSQDHWFNGGHRRICSLPSDTERLVKPCVVCGKASIVGCNRCMFTYYCSQECQMQHWYEGGHDKSCPRKPLPDP